MNLEVVEEKIRLLYDEIFQVEKSNKRLSDIEFQLEVLYRDLGTHKTKMEKEHEDVRKLEKISAHKLFGTILGNQQEQLEKERQEYLQAVLEYNSIAREIDLLRYEQEVLFNKPRDISKLRHSLDYFLKVKEQRILYQNSKLATTIKELNYELDQLQTFLREVKEAIAVAKVVDQVLLKAFTKLKKVKDFQYKKMKGAGKYSSIAKKSFIDEAIKDISEINFYLGKLDNELSDIYTRYPFFSIYKYQDFVNSFYDYLISDWILQNKLNNAIQCLKSAIDEVKIVLKRLDRDRSKTEASIKEIMKIKKELVRTG